MSIYSLNILSVCLSVLLQKALLVMDVVILVFYYSTVKFLNILSSKLYILSCLVRTDFGLWTGLVLAVSAASAPGRVNVTHLG